MRVERRLRAALSVGTALLCGIGTFGCGIAFLVEVPAEGEAAFSGFSGRLVDYETGKAVAQARVIVKATSTQERRPYYVFSGADGTFQIGQYVEGGQARAFEAGDKYVLIFTSNEHRLKRFPVQFRGGSQDLGLIELLPVRIGGEVQPVIPGTREGDPSGAGVVLRVGPPVP